MKWIDYREKLGIGINDVEKLNMLKNKLSISLEDLHTIAFGKGLHKQWGNALSDFYYEIAKKPVDNKNEFLIISITNHFSIIEIICHYVAFMNAFCKHFDEENNIFVVNMLKVALRDLKIQYEIIKDDDGMFIFPKGAKELDDALVSEPLEWLNDYPNAHKTFVIALKQYSDGIYIRDVADNLRKALETFLQEFLGNGKNLESNKNEICKYLGERGVDAGVPGLYQTLINTYKNLNDRIAKHNDAVDKKMLEFLLYQTGLLIRMVITIKTEDKTNAD